MNVGIVDIGTNTILLLVAQIDEAGRITPLVYEQRTPRLGKGVDARRELRADAIQRALAVLGEYKEMMSGVQLSGVVVAGTSALRDARNGDEFAELVKKTIGCELEILSGEEEAFWTYKGAVSGIPVIGQACVIDVGGGSTELTLGNALTINSTRSLDLGAVRLTERYFHHDPPTPTELWYATGHIREQLAALDGVHLGSPTVIAVAGTATSLAMLDQGIRRFHLQAVTNYVLRQHAVETLLRQLCDMPSLHIADLSAIMDGRSDVITAGTLILREIMSYFGFSQVIVSERGVRYGLALREWEKQKRGAP